MIFPPFVSFFLLIACPLSAVEKKARSDDPVLIVGGGLAGLSAALAALNHNVNVVIIDGEPNLGGNSAKASSGVSACETNTQKRLGIKDSRDLFYNDTMNGGDRENDNTLVNVLVNRSSGAIEFLVDLGVNLSDVNLCGGHSVPRTHWTPPSKEGRASNIGMAIVRAAMQRIKNIEAGANNLTILTSARVTGLALKKGRVSGVTIVQNGTQREVHGKAVILTTGGFSADKDDNSSLLFEFAKDKIAFPTTNGAFARGDGVKMARKVGAQLLGMDRIQVHPTAFVDPADPSAGTKFLAAEALRGKGAILINSDGFRFTNELDRRDRVTERLLKACRAIEKFQGGSGGRPAAIMLINDKAVDAFGRAAFSFYAEYKKFFIRYDTIAKFASAAGIPLDRLNRTLTEYNSLAKANTSVQEHVDSFGKSVFPVAFELSEAVFASIITPALHYTMGGVKIDSQARVYHRDGHPIQGLLAAGEVTGWFAFREFAQ